MASRRGFLGLMAGGAVAGPSMVRQAAQVAVNGAGVGFAESAGFAQSSLIGEPIDELSMLRADLARMLGKSAADIAREKRERHVGYLDGDIAGMRSLAWHAKIAMQRDRDYERDTVQHRSWLEQRIVQLLKHDG